MKFDSFSQLSNQLEKDPDLEAKFKNDPIGAIKEIADNPIKTDKWIYRVVVGSLGFTILATVVGAIILASRGSDIPPGIYALATGALGALAGLLAPAPERV